MRDRFFPPLPNGDQPEPSPSGAAGTGGQHPSPNPTLPPEGITVSHSFLPIIALSSAGGVAAVTAGVIAGVGGPWLLTIGAGIAAALAFQQVRKLVVQMNYDFLAVMKRAERAVREFDRVAAAYWQLHEQHTHRTGERKHGDGGVVIAFPGCTRETS